MPFQTSKGRNKKRKRTPMFVYHLPLIYVSNLQQCCYTLLDWINLVTDTCINNDHQEIAIWLMWVDDEYCSSHQIMCLRWGERGDYCMQTHLSSSTINAIQQYKAMRSLFLVDLTPNRLQRQYSCPSHVTQIGYKHIGRQVLCLKLRNTLLCDNSLSPLT